MEERRLWELIGKRIAGEADAGELEELNSLLEKFPEALYTLETMGFYWRSAGEKADSLQREAALERHMRRIAANRAADEANSSLEGLNRAANANPATPGLWLYRRLIIGAAAAAAVFTGCLLLIPVLTKKTPKNFEIAVTTKRERRQLLLPDGSTVWLNAGTTITYRQTPDSMREVTLSGEAYFSVRHDASHPFVVHTGRMDIRDIGTAFNVRAYPLDKTIEATLVEGSIDVRLSKGKGGAVLTKPHQKFILSQARQPGANRAPGVDAEPGVDSGQGADSGADAKPGAARQTYQVSTAVIGAADSLLAETAWMKNMLVFRNESFEELARRMERWYDVTIRFTEDGPARYRFTGVVADESLEQALQELQIMKRFHFRIDGKTVSIGQ